MPENTVPVSGAFFALPSTTPGRMSAMLLALDVVLIALTVVVFDVPNEIGPSSLGRILGMANGASMLAGIVTGAIALIGKRERSWMVWVSAAVPAIVLGIEVAQVLSSGGGVTSSDSVALRS